MKKGFGKILIIFLLLVMILSVSACNASDFWGYFTGNFPEIGEIPADDVYLSQGTVGTQSGGLADVIEDIRPTIVDVYSRYVYSAFVTGELYEAYLTGMAVIVQKSEDGIYLLCASYCVEDDENRTINGKPYYFSYVQTSVAVGNKYYQAERKFVDEETASAVLFVSRKSLGEAYDDIKVAQLPEIFAPKEGQTILAFSNPYGVNDGTVTKGILSSSKREIQLSDDKTYVLLQTDAALCYNSDGIIFDESGGLLGIIFVKAVGTGVENLSFAMPIDQIINACHENGYLLNVVIGEINE